MSDLISRKALLQEIEPLLTWELLAKINKMPAVDRWISVKDQLPDLCELKSDWVIGIVNGRVNNVEYIGAVDMVAYDDGHWWLSDHPEVDVSVSHWMPLPEGPGEF